MSKRGLRVWGEQTFRAETLREVREKKCCLSSAARVYLRRRLIYRCLSMFGPKPTWLFILFIFAAAASLCNYTGGGWWWGFGQMLCFQKVITSFGLNDDTSRHILYLHPLDVSVLPWKLKGKLTRPQKPLHQIEGSKCSTHFRELEQEKKRENDLGSMFCRNWTKAGNGLRQKVALL